MPQNIIEDIITPGVRKIPETSRRTARESIRRRRIDKKRSSFFRGFGGGGGNDSKKPSYILWGIATFTLLFLIISFSTIFEHATIKIVPQQKIENIDFVFSAQKNSEDTSISFSVMTIEMSESKVIPATEIKNVERRASGKIVVYNDFNTYNQRLVKNTRFETPEGLVYRISESVVVPGQKTVSGGTIPGSIEVVVYADEVGDIYNGGLTDFTVPGFKGTARYSKFYARSKTPMEGGFKGVVKTVSDEDLKKTVSELREKVTQGLLEVVHSSKPDSFILYDDAIFIVFDESGDVAEQKDTGKSNVEIKESAKLYGLIFNEDAFGQRLAEKVIPEISEDDRIRVLNLENLKFTLSNKDDIDPLNIEEISFSLKGESIFVWKFDEEKLKTLIAGTQKDEVKNILIEFPSIVRAEVIIRPFWKRSFPVKIKDFTVEIIIN